MNSIFYQNTYQKFIYKIKSEVLASNNWNITINPTIARIKDQIIAISDSQALRFIMQIKKINVQRFEDNIADIHKEIRQVKGREYYQGQKQEIKKLYAKLDKAQIIEDYVVVEFQTTKDFDRANRGFLINNNEYVRLLGMTGGVKNKCVIYVNKKIYSKLNEKIINGHNQDFKIVPNKYEAYKSLSCSSSTPIPFTKKILVVNDCETTFYDDIIEMDDTVAEEPRMTYIENAKVDMDASDGYGLVTPEYNRRINQSLGLDANNSGHCLRGSFCKGMIVPFDFKLFAKEIAHKNIVVDAWGNKYNIEDIDMILTTSMLKLWKEYKSIEDYISNCEKNDFGFSVTKSCQTKLENVRELNYQFIQSYELSDEDLMELVTPTIEKFKDILQLDWEKSLLFLRGIGLTENNTDYLDYDFVQALTIESDLLSDYYVKTKIFNMLQKKINQAKIGRLEINANFQVIVGDPYSLCQSIFGMEVTGLLKKDEIYSRYWEDRNVPEVVGFRAPMTPHNNIRKVKIAYNEECDKWYSYLRTVIVLNSWDTITQATNGSD